jgi:thiol-disulfide isomerase/thioredoxin
MTAKFITYGILIVMVSISCSNNSKKQQATPEASTSELQVGNQIGNLAPDIKAKTPDGEAISLHSLQGKMVLLDFWASWCPPCRIENPNLVQYYHEFKNKSFVNGDNFTIFSVSLDQNKEQWVEAIQTDNLVWDYHVSDLNGWMSVPAAQYQVEAIPTNFLINGDGVIIAKDLRSEALHAVLEQNLE